MSIEIPFDNPRVRKSIDELRSAFNDLINAQDPLVRDALTKEAKEKLLHTVDVIQAVHLRNTIAIKNPDIN